MKSIARAAAVAALACSALSSPSAAEAHSFTQCKGQSDHLGVADVKFLPDPPQAGKPVTVEVSGTSGVSLDAGQVSVDIRILGVTVAHESMPLCDVAPCPIEQGKAYSAKVTQDIPSETPDRLTATVRVQVLGGDGKSVSCLESQVTIASKPDLQSQESKELVGEPAWGLMMDEVKFMFHKWQKQFGKTSDKIDVFRENMIKIAYHNTDKQSTYTMALNQFGDLTEEEFGKMYLSGLKFPSEEEKRVFKRHPNAEQELMKLRGSLALADPPAEIDWVARGAVTEVKNQAACGSCWSFSAIGALESSYFLKTGKLVEFSEQEVVSCDGDGVHGGSDFACNGGLMDNAFDWIIHGTSSGLCSEQDYPYTSGSTSQRGQCRMDACQPVEGSKPVGFVDIPPNEAALMAAVATHGPVSVAIEADQAAFQFYHSGVMTGACGTNLNHGVLLVGYGVYEETGQLMWKVKNSWGVGWGSSGYIYLQRGKRWPNARAGQCGIALKASYPIFENQAAA